MPKFRVYANTRQTLSIVLEADNKYEAYRKAKEADGGDFTEENTGDWEVESNTIEEVK